MAVLVVVALGAWGSGAIERLLYLMQVNSIQSELIEHREQADQGAQSRQAGRSGESGWETVNDLPDQETEGDQASLAGEREQYWYAYSQLDSDADREKYLVLLDAFQSREKRTYPETDMDDLSRMRDCVIADHPELFYVNGAQITTTTNSMTGLVTNVTVEGQYTFSEEEVETLQAQIDEEVTTCMAGLSDDADDYAKAKYFYEYLTANVQYDHAATRGEGALGASSGQTIADALAAHSAVCAGYAHAYQYLLGQVGVPCVYVTGTAKSGPHAWCEVFLDGYWYHVDPTWGDPQFFSEEGGAVDAELINYDYLCVTDDDIAATHVSDCAYPLPVCMATADNYYVREGLFLTEGDVDAAGAIVQSAVAHGDEAARFRCANDEAYNQIAQALFDGGQIYRFIPGTSCSYVLNDAMRTVEVLLA